MMIGFRERNSLPYISLINSLEGVIGFHTQRVTKMMEKHHFFNYSGL